MTREAFYLQEKRMDNFLNWMANTVHSIIEMNQNEYQQIFIKIQNKADGKNKNISLAIKQN